MWTGGSRGPKVYSTKERIAERGGVTRTVRTGLAGRRGREEVPWSSLKRGDQRKGNAEEEGQRGVEKAILRVGGRGARSSDKKRSQKSGGHLLPVRFEVLLRGARVQMAEKPGGNRIREGGQRGQTIRSQWTAHGGKD